MQRDEARQTTNDDKRHRFCLQMAFVTCSRLFHLPMNFRVSSAQLRLTLVLNSSRDVKWD
jgi:hypothetical protein